MLFKKQGTFYIKRKESYHDEGLLPTIHEDPATCRNAKRVFTGCYGMPILTSREDLKTFKAMKTKPWHYEVTAFHPLGTCRMGNDPRRSVVNLNLEAHDIKGLFITDGSPFPTSLGVNPQVTIMSFATRASDYIAKNINRY